MPWPFARRGTPARAVRRADRLLLPADVPPSRVGKPFELLENQPSPRVVG